MDLIASVVGLVIDFELNGAADWRADACREALDRCRICPRGDLPNTLRRSRLLVFEDDWIGVAGGRCGRGIRCGGKGSRCGGCCDRRRGRWASLTVFALPLVFWFWLAFPFSWAFPFWSMLMVLWVTGCPGITLSKSRCEFWATPLGWCRNPPACAGVKLSPALTRVVPSDSTTVPFVGSPLTWKVTLEDASLGTLMSSALPNTEL